MVSQLGNTLNRDWKSYGFMDWETTEALIGQGIGQILIKKKDWITIGSSLDSS
ncbi:hypothetical protein M3683_23050 [Metabacillus halosaccharovorans]|nr:hypothetical protein [Metabacillus halosaccharovorans]MCM3443742.1 hypothetical protein [Metabacillus halosaccharovorans]